MRSFESDPDDSIDEYPDSQDQDDPDTDHTDPYQICPHCGKSVYEDVVCCPTCGFFLTDEIEQSDVRGSQTWVWVIVGLLVIALFGGFYTFR